MKRHEWKQEHGQRTQTCAACNLRRRRPMSNVRKGRAAVSDWEYHDAEADTWTRLQRVPPCEPPAAASADQTHTTQRLVAAVACPPTLPDQWTGLAQFAHAFAVFVELAQSEAAEAGAALDNVSHLAAELADACRPLFTGEKVVDAETVPPNKSRRPVDGVWISSDDVAAIRNLRDRLALILARV